MSDIHTSVTDRVANDPLDKSKVLGNDVYGEFEAVCERAARQFEKLATIPEDCSTEDSRPTEKQLWTFDGHEIYSRSQ